MSKLDEIGEILQLLQSGNLTDEEIKALANRKYSHKETLNENQYACGRGFLWNAYPAPPPSSPR